MRILLICISGILFVGITLSACTIYRINVQQGNVLDEDAVEKLKIGMSKQQVQFILGSPIIKDVFHPERWDYVHTLRKGNGDTIRRTITIFFAENKVVKMNDSDDKYFKVEPESNTSSDKS